MSTWFITGAARGLGHALARRALAAGDQVVATARRRTDLDAAFASAEGVPDRFLGLELDIADEQGTIAAARAAVDRFGAVDHLVNNAGRGLLGAVEEASADEVEAVFTTNVFGLLHMTRAVLPHMRERASGSVINIGSMGGFAQVAGWGVYGATKFAIEGLSESMRAELAPLGISVMVVEPGSFRTGFLDRGSLQATGRRFPEYADTAGRVRDAAALGDGRQPNDPARGADAIYAAVASERPPFRLQLGPDAVAVVEAKLARVREELDEWRALASSTLFEDDAVRPAPAG